MTIADHWRRWRHARMQARVKREIADYDDRLLQDMGLKRGDHGTIVPFREPDVSSAHRKSRP